MSVPVLDGAREERLSRLRVVALYLFGSRARGEEGPNSDYDYAVLMPEGDHRKGEPLYLELYEKMSDVTTRTHANHENDSDF